MQQQIQPAQFWVGVSFAAAFVLFLMYSISKGKDLNSGQRLMLRILSAICGGISAALISGEAFFNLAKNLPGGKLTVSGTAGFAIFLVIWFTFPKGPKYEPLPPGFNISIPLGRTFQAAADSCAKIEHTDIDYDGLTNSELRAPLKEWELHTGSPLEAINKLGSITQERGAVRPYEVKNENNKFVLRVKA